MGVSRTNILVPGTLPSGHQMKSNIDMQGVCFGERDGRLQIGTEPSYSLSGEENACRVNSVHVRTVIILDGTGIHACIFPRPCKSEVGGHTLGTKHLSSTWNVRSLRFKAQMYLYFKRTV